MKFNVTFKQGLKVVAQVKGVCEVRPENLTLKDMEQVLQVVEPLLERITGLRVHVEQVQ